MKKAKYYLMVLGGILLAGGGIVFLRMYSEPEGIMSTLPYICVGLGCGIFGHGMGEVLKDRALKNSPDIRKQLEIDQNDERNIAISNMAKAKAYDLMIFVFGALMVSFALMKVDLACILMLVFSYLFVVGYGVYFRLRYDKEM